MNICGVTFKDGGKVYNFSANGLDLKIGDYVIVETEKGEQFGKIFSLTNKMLDLPLKNILRIATNKDYDYYLKTLAAAKIALDAAKVLAKQLNLNMQLIDATYTFDKKQLLFNFIADERVDFRELVKQLAYKYKTRIELHQMGVRDKAKEIGGIGPCGHELCCTKFLNHIDAITINMAKNQNIALNPAKINGACGRLLCCLSYEDDCYLRSREILPQVGSTKKINGKEGRIVSIDLLKQSYTIEIEGESKEIFIDDQERNK